jgi:hypothetical protein
MTNAPIDMHEFVGRTNTFKNGYAGASMNVHTMRPHNLGDTGFIVGQHGPHTETTYGRYDDATGHAQRNRMLSDPSVQSDPHTVMGTWHQGPQGAEPTPREVTTTDRGRHIDTGRPNRDRLEAVKQGHAGNQDAVFDLKNEKDVRTKSMSNKQAASVTYLRNQRRTPDGPPARR